MTPLRQRMIEDMQIRNLAPSTQETYLQKVSQFAQYFRRSPEHLGPQEIREYQVYILKERVSPAGLTQTIAALRFLYGQTLKRPWTIEAIPYPKTIKKLPIVLSREEVTVFLGSVKNLKHKAMLMTLYGCGLRSAEAIYLRVEDIDSKRMLLHIRRGKGGKPRVVPLSTKLLKVLRMYWKEYRPGEWLFPGRSGDQPMNVASLGSACRKAAREAPIVRHVTPHSLRHSYATHLLEDGVDLRTIQVVLGHGCVSSTAIYTHVSTKKLHEAVSPMDSLLNLGV